MNIFVKVVEKGSFSAAAESCGLTSTMVGNHVRSLEEHLGTRLLIRTTRHHSLSDAGQEYYEKCITILGLLTEAETAAQEMRSTPKGSLRVSAPVNFGSEGLAPVIASYSQAYPEVTVELSLDNRIVDIAKEGFDLAIRVGMLPDSSHLVARPLKASRRVLCASPEYLERMGKPQTIQELTKHNCLCFAYPNGPERDWRFTTEDGAHDLVHVQGTMSVNNGHALRSAALSGLGIIFQPESLVRAYLESGKLVWILPQKTIHVSPLQLVYVQDRQMPPKTKTFIAFLLEHFS